ncbi:MAG: DUF1937 family protein [Thermodesulfovibrionales bacterium]|nr:DUF1937 family protein [Thermodesulfovibrionales bacterium]
MNRGLYYFAHPYTCVDADGNYVSEGEDANFRICNYRAGRLMSMGYNLYSPISHTHPIHRASPIFLARHEHEAWYYLDLEFIARTNFDGIILAPAWELSKGCQMEREAFERKNLPVYLYTDIINAPAEPIEEECES